METKDIIAFILIEVAAFVLAFAWFQDIYDPYAWVITFCLLIILGLLFYMITSINTRLAAMEARMETRDKAIRVSIMTVEADLENKLDKLNNNIEKAVSEINKKRFI
ncbi:MAG: hypothetical protein FWE78_02690 [Methanimicrococcus sp.]|nr:hypothetical protein [Methanimicrococcus sp.]